MNPDIEAVRKQIDLIDDKLGDLLDLRITLSEYIQRSRKDAGGSSYDKGRERAILARAKTEEHRALLEFVLQLCHVET